MFKMIVRFSLVFAFWPAFVGQAGFVQKLVPGPAQPFPITNLSAEHNCDALTSLGLIKP